jgi:glutamine cyclotransferase
MIKVQIANPCSNEALAIKSGFDGKCTLIAESLLKLTAKWRSIVNTGVETKDVVTPIPDESILLTDLIISSSKKVAGSTITVQFSDGVNTEILLTTEGASAPIEFSHAFAGGLTGWKDAVLQVITDQAAMNVTTLAGYVKISKALTKNYTEWDNER